VLAPLHHVNQPGEKRDGFVYQRSQSEGLSSHTNPRTVAPEPSLSPPCLMTLQIRQSKVAGAGAATRAAAAAVVALASMAAAQHHAAVGAGAVLLDFEGIVNNRSAGHFYAGGGGGPSQNYGISFGASAIGAVDLDAPGGSFNVAREPSPDTALFLFGAESQAYMTVPRGFTALSFQYASDRTFSVTPKATVYDGPDQTGTVLGATGLPVTGVCDVRACGDPNGQFGVWVNVTVPFSGVARSVGFSISTTDSSLWTT
jgi:hypothetical protein